MNDNQEDIICYCSGTTKTKVRELIQEGITSIDKISSITGAYTGCGGCEALILEFLKKETLN